LFSLGPWPGADVRLNCANARWDGVGAGLDGGSGRLGERRVEVQVSGRGLAPAGRAQRLLLPARTASSVVADPVPAAVGVEDRPDGVVPATAPSAAKLAG
jgi:hypothetical protein